MLDTLARARRTLSTPLFRKQKRTLPGGMLHMGLATLLHEWQLSQTSKEIFLTLYTV